MCAHLARLQIEHCGIGNGRMPDLGQLFGFAAQFHGVSLLYVSARMQPKISKCCFSCCWQMQLYMDMDMRQLSQKLLFHLLCFRDTPSRKRKFLETRRMTKIFPTYSDPTLYQLTALFLRSRKGDSFNFRDMWYMQLQLLWKLIKKQSQGNLKIDPGVSKKQNQPERQVRIRWLVFPIYLHISNTCPMQASPPLLSQCTRTNHPHVANFYWQAWTVNRGLFGCASRWRRLQCATVASKMRLPKRPSRFLRAPFFRGARVACRACFWGSTTGSNTVNKGTWRRCCVLPARNNNPGNYTHKWSLVERCRRPEKSEKDFVDVLLRGCLCEKQV